MARVLVVEDQKRHLDSLRRGLEAEGYDVVTASTGEEGLAQTTGEEVDVLVLDLMLPGRDGMSLLRELRSSGFAKPILILSARDAVEDRVRRAFQTGVAGRGRQVCQHGREHLKGSLLNKAKSLIQPSDQLPEGMIVPAVH